MASSLSVQDKLALAMTSAGSQRALAALVGVSHQRVGRWLTIGQTAPDGTPSTVQAPTDPAILDAIDAAFAIHTDMARAQAQADRIPFDARLPVFAQRLPLNDGTPGTRVVIKNTHRIRDDVRNRVISKAHSTKKYMAVSVRSTVNLRAYFNRSEKNHDPRQPAIGMQHRSNAAWINRAVMKLELKQGLQTKPIFTQYTTMDSAFPADQILGELNWRLRQRHEPAIDPENSKTKFADEILFQLDSRRDAMGAKHEKRTADRKRKRAAVAAKARRDKSRDPAKPRKKRAKG